MNKNFIQNRIDSIRHSVWSFFVDRWRLTLITMLAILLGGVISLTSMPLESDPEVKIPIGVVTTAFPGASPTDVEELITDRLETELSNLDDLKLLTSGSSEGISSITVEFEASADITESIRKLRDRVSDAKSKLPEEAEDPFVTEIRSSDRPIITFSLLGQLSPETFKKFGDDLKDELEKINNVSKATLSGVEEKEIQILIDPISLEGLNLSLGQIIQSIQNNHLDFPVGSLKIKNFYYQASLKGQLDSPEKLMELPIANREGRNIFLKDIAEVREVFAEPQTFTQIYRAETMRYNPSITLQVYKKTGGNIIEITEEAKSVIENYQKNILPPSVEVVVTGDNSEFIRDDIRTLGNSGLQAIAVIFILLFIALGFKEALLAAASLPFIFLISFIGLFFSGETFNFMVLFSLILSLGLIVDTSIVMMEGVHENLKEHKLPSKEAALLAIRTYKTPLISSTFTTISAFIPMALTPGIVGQYISHIPRTVAITLFSSLFVAIFIIPSLAAHLFRKVHQKELKSALLDRFMGPLKIWYSQKIHRILVSKTKRRLWVVGMVVTSFIALSLPFTGLMKVQLFPKANGDFFTVSIEGPIGSTLEDTLAITKQVEEKIETLPELDNFVTIVGGSALVQTSDGPPSSGGRTSFHQASITINLIKKRFRNFTSTELADQLREKVKPITKAEVKVEDLQTGPPVGADLEVRITGDELKEVEIYAEKIARLVESIEGARDIETDIERGTGEFYFDIKREQLKFYGLSVAQLATEIRSAAYGNRQIKVIQSGEETPMVIRLDFRTSDCKNNQLNQILEKRDKRTICNLNPKNIDQINRLLIQTPKGQVPLSELTEVSLNPTITTIHHRETDRIINVRAYARQGFIADDIRKELALEIEKLVIPDGISVQFGGEFEETAESFNSLWKAMYVGLILIIFILVLQFNSFRQPFIIIFTLPLALIGVFFGLTAVGRNFSFPAFIGIVALMGVVVNDAIVLIDRINTNIRAGMEKIEAIVRAGKERMQPIFLTTITTATGVLPLVWASEFWVDLALAIFFGIIFATVLTLVMVPIFYNALESGEELKMLRDSNSEPL